MGAGFGNKNQGFDFDLIAALLAKRTGRPVRVEFTRHEDFIAIHGRWSTQQHYRIGYKKDGTLTAIHLKCYSNMGAYLRSSGGVQGPTNYYAPNIKSEVYRVHTNRAVSANFRGPAGPQGVFAIDSAMDDIAYKLGMDPVEFRAKNAVKDLWNNKIPLTNNGLRECLQKGAEAIGWAEKRKLYDEFGMAGLQAGFDAGRARAYEEWAGRARPEARHVDVVVGVIRKAEDVAIVLRDP